jgi:hypothetical protein
VLGPLERSNLNHFSITHHRHKPLHYICKIPSGIGLSAVLIHDAEECPDDWKMIFGKIMEGICFLLTGNCLKTEEYHEYRQ